MNYIEITRKFEVSKERNKIKLKFIPIFQQFIKAAENGEILTKQGNKYKSGTINRYRNTLDYLIEYEETNSVILIDDITPIWADLFRNYLGKYKITKGTVSRHISCIKSVLNRAYIAGITLRTGYGISAPQDRPMTVFNTLYDLRKLKKLDLRDYKVERICDIYIMNCFLGMRWSDLIEFIAEPKKYLKYINGKFFISISSKKTDIESIIPISSEVREILQKWNYNFGKKFSQQYYNYSIKKLSKQAGINETVIVKKTIAGEKQIFEFPKWKLISSHTARRTFVSLCVLHDIRHQNIMKMSGHKSEQAFQSYVRISSIQNAIKLSNHEFFKIKL